MVIGFSQATGIQAERELWYYPTAKGEGNRVSVPSINPYLLPGSMVTVGTRRALLSPDAPRASYWSMLIEHGHLVVDSDEAAALAESDTVAVGLLRAYVGAREMLHFQPRYCLWLDGIEPGVIRRSSFVMSRVADSRQFRESSNGPATRALAATPHLFGERRQPSQPYIAIPKVSSRNRAYLPLAILSPDVVASGSLILVEAPELLHTFGVLSLRVLAAWNAVVSGRMKSDFQFSVEITYNNFPYPSTSIEQREAIEVAAQGVLDARDAHPNASLADLYDPLVMPKDLHAAHKALDKAVLTTYGLPADATESQILETFFARYRDLDAAGRLPTPVTTTAEKARAAAKAPSQAAAVRAWATQNGLTVPARGRIPKEVRDAYNQAQSPSSAL